MLINLFLTLRCNLNCDYCYAESSSHAVSMPTEIALDSAKFVLDTAQKAKARTLGFVFIGGEPLLCIDTIKEIIEYVKAHKEKISFPISYISTINGTLLTPEIVRFLKDNNFHISFSIDGPAMIHNTHRRYHSGRGSFGDVYRAVALANHTLLETVARMTFTSKTVNHLSESVRYIADLGFKTIKVVPDFFDPGWARDHVTCCKEQFDLILSWLPSYLNAGHEIRIGPIEQRLSQNVKRTCSAGLSHTQFSIGPNGNIYPCSYLVGDPEFVIGDIYSGIDLHRAQKVHCVHQQPFARIACQGCSLFSTCDSGRCTFLNLKMTGKMDVPSAFYCAYEKMMFGVVKKYRLSGLATHPTLVSTSL